MAHTGDAIAWYAQRINRVLNEDRPALDSFDWDAHTATQRYHERRLPDVLATVRGSCASLTAELDALTVTAWGVQAPGQMGQHAPSRSLPIVQDTKRNITYATSNWAAP